MEMKMLLFHVASAVLFATLWTGCAMPPREAMGHHQGAMAGMDMKSMCDMHRQMMSGKTPQERQAMMEEHMKSMPPEMRQHMQMMDEQCK